MPLRRWLLTCAAIGVVTVLLLAVLLLAGRPVLAVIAFGLGITALVLYSTNREIWFARKLRRLRR